LLIILLDDQQPITDREPQLTDDEDSNGRNVSPTEQDLPEIEQQKKRRRTANYQHIISTTTTNGNHEDERTSTPLSMSNYCLCNYFYFLLIASTNSVGSLSNRRIIDNGSNTANTTPVLLQTSTEQNHNEGTNRLTSSKQRFNIPSTTRGLIPSYDPSQSPLFSVSVRVSHFVFLEKPIKKTPFILENNRNNYVTKSNHNESQIKCS